MQGQEFEQLKAPGQQLDFGLMELLWVLNVVCVQSVHYLVGLCQSVSNGGLCLKLSSVSVYRDAQVKLQALG